MKKTIFAFLVLTLIIATACEMTVSQIREGDALKDRSFDPNINIRSGSFASEEEYISFVKKYQSSSGYYMRSGGLELMDMAMEVMAVSDSKALLPSQSAGLDYSETNIQVIGVDEGDILKTDGNYIYTITEKTLFLIKAYPGEDAEVISQLSFEDYPRGIFIDGDRMSVFGDVANTNILADKGIRIRNGMAFLNIYDISDRENPVLEEEFKFEGRYHNSRKINDKIYLVTNIYPEYRIDYPTPIIMDGSSVIKMPVEDIHFFNIPYRNPSFVGIHSIDIDSGNKESSKVLAIEGQPSIYMSHNNLYITYTEYINEWDLRQELMRELIYPELPEFYKQLITKIENTDLDVLSTYEKQSKIQQIYYEYVSGLSSEEQNRLEDELEELLEKKLEEFEYFEYTVINKVKIDKGSIEIDSNGKAPGRILNQFSMDEYDNVFRIATTISARWSRFGKERTLSTNNVYTFDDSLKMLGKIEGLAEGESIFSARFMGERLYMVTFEQIDPFFVIDLSNPSQPENLGELKIPGFSRYLHPYDENTIIGIGRDATEQGRQLGLKISLFDVSDVSDPKEIAKYVSDDRYSQSAAEWEHKAFLFSKEKDLLVIPVVNYDWRESSDNYNGAFVFEIKKTSIKLRGLIDHSKSLGSRWYSPGVERSLYIEDLLYTKSPNLLRINRINNLNGVKDIELTPGYQGKIPIY